MKTFGAIMVSSPPQAVSTGDDHNKRPALLVASVAAFLTPFMGSSVNIALPVMARDFANVPVSVLLIVLVRTFRGERADAKGEKFDFPGALIYIAALIAVMLGFSFLPARSGAGLLALGAAGNVAFVRWEMKTPHPVLRMQLFRNTVFAAGTLGTMRLTGQMFSMGIATLIFAVYLGQVPITPSNHLLFMKGVRSAFVIFVVLCLGGTIASLARGKVEVKESS